MQSTPENRERRWSAPMSAIRRHGPGVLLILLPALKLSYFNLPHGITDNEWYAWSLREGLVAFAGSFAFLLIVYTMLSGIRESRRYLSLIILNLFLTFVVLGDVIHYRYFGDITSLSAAGGAWQVGLILETIRGLLAPTDALLFVDVALAFWWWSRRRRIGWADSASRLSLRTAVPAFGLAALFAVPASHAAVTDKDGVFRWEFFRVYQARKIGLWNFHMYEATRKVWSNVFVRGGVPDDDKKQALAFMADWRKEATAPSALHGVARGKNVIVVMMESMQNFVIGLEVDGQQIAPNLTALTKESMYFPNFYEETWEGSTSDGEFTSMQSLFPMSAGVVATRFASNDFRGLPAILADHGYATMSAHAFYGSLYKMREIHPRLGFQRSYFRESFEQTQQLGLGLADGEFFRQVVPRIRELPRPFMSFLISLSSHYPYRMPEEYHRLTLKSVKGRLANYLQSVYYADSALGALMTDLKSTGLLDSSLVVLYGDHSAKIDAGPLGKLLFPESETSADPDSGSRDDFDVRVWQEQRRVPLIIRFPGGASAGVKDVVGGQVDILPTVLGLLGVQDSMTVTVGRDLTQGQHSLVAWRSGSFIAADTVCVSGEGASIALRCWNSRMLQSLDTTRFNRLRDEARLRLDVSNTLVVGNLIRRP